MKYLIGLMLAFTFLFSQAQDQKFSRPDLPGELMVDIGFNFWKDVADTIDTKGWGSKSVNISYMKRKPLGNKFSFYYGLGWGMERIDFGGTSRRAFTLQADSLSNTSFSTFTTSSGRAVIDKYRLAISYLDIPVEFRFHPLGTQDGEGFFVGFGGMIGLRIKSFDKLVVKLNGDKFKTKDIYNYGLNSIRYGLQGRIGWRGVHLFYKQYFSDVFKDDIAVLNPDPTATEPYATFNPTTITVGINFTGF